MEIKLTMGKQVVNAQFRTALFLTARNVQNLWQDIKLK